MKERLYKKAVKFISFSFVGTTTFAMQLFFTVLFTEAFSIIYYISHAIALLIAWSVNFTLNMKYTFGVKDKVGKRMRRFACLASANSLLNWFFVLFLVERMHAHYFISILIVTLTLSAVTFATEEVWVFARTKVKRIQPQLAAK